MPACLQQRWYDDSNSWRVMTEERLSSTTIILHWSVAAAVFFLFMSSWWMLGLPLPSDNFTYRELPFQLHKNLGITLILLVVVMIGVRINHKRQQTAVTRTQIEKLAELDHLLTYVLLIACCVSGYLSSSYSGWTTTVWWLIDFPNWAEENDELNIFYSDIHLWTCWALLAVIAIHIAAALFHAFNDDDVIKKMFRL